MWSYEEYQLFMFYIKPSICVSSGPVMSHIPVRMTLQYQTYTSGNVHYILVHYHGRDAANKLANHDIFINIGSAISFCISKRSSWFPAISVCNLKLI